MMLKDWINYVLILHKFYMDLFKTLIIVPSLLWLLDLVHCNHHQCMKILFSLCNQYCISSCWCCSCLYCTIKFFLKLKNGYKFERLKQDESLDCWPARKHWFAVSSLYKAIGKKDMYLRNKKQSMNWHHYVLESRIVLQILKYGV